MLCFNTASGKYCCNFIKALLFSFGFNSFNTASGKYCCNSLITKHELQTLSVSIPQAVSTVATLKGGVYAEEVLSRVSIPQAVSTVATCICSGSIASVDGTVSIPQAVSTVATTKGSMDLRLLKLGVSIPQAVSTVATKWKESKLPQQMSRFNTASGKYCCNYLIYQHNDGT